VPKQSDHAGVLIPPPLLFVVPLLLGIWLHTRQPWTILVTPARAMTVVGIAAVAAGLALDLIAVGAFRRRGTTVLPALRPTSAIVAAGPYRFTRNPMYVGMAIMYVGFSVVLNTAWPLVFLPFSVLAVDRYVIRREERYLAAKFGAEYDRYRQTVRRWL
jgi:protein-S-isoprenylcysteine O-methyltransferase Ste14